VRLRLRLSSVLVMPRSAQVILRGRVKAISDKPAAMRCDQAREQAVATPSGQARAIPHNALQAGRLGREI
jgi:hypothetical protein